MTPDEKTAVNKLVVRGRSQCAHRVAWPLRSCAGPGIADPNGKARDEPARGRGTPPEEESGARSSGYIGPPADLRLRGPQVQDS